MQLRRFTVPAAVLVAGLAIGGGTALAASENGASVTESSGCRPILDGVICSESRWVVKRTQTPSGNYLSIAVGDTSFTYTGADGCIWSGSQKKREHWTSTSGETQVAHVIQITDRFITCFGESSDCTTDLHFMVAEGDARIWKQETECRPVESV